jgi:hypothetical protein
MSSLSPLSVLITFIRKDQRADSYSDDRLQIRKDFETNDFEVTYRDANIGIGAVNSVPVIHKLSGLYRERVLEHVYLLLKNQYLDTDGFAEIQIDVPAMPRVLLKAENMYDLYYRDHIYDLVGAALDNLENGERVEPKTQTQSRREAQPPAQAHLNTQFYQPQTPDPHLIRRTARTPRPLRRSSRIASASPDYTGQHLYFDE